MSEVIVLSQFPRSKTVTNLSFFCMKVETFMRMTAIPYQIESIINPGKAPKGKLPYITHQGQIIPDSSHILEYLKTQFSLTIDDDLSSEQLAIGHAVTIMLEERLRWCVMYSRWLDDRYAPTFRNMFSEFISSPLKIIFPLLINQSKKRIAKTLSLNGIAKFTPKEIYAFGQQDLAALTTILGNKLYLLGDKPSSYDAITYAVLANLIDIPIDCPLNTFARDRQTLQDYCQRMKKTYFADLDRTNT